MKDVGRFWGLIMMRNVLKSLKGLFLSYILMACIVFTGQVVFAAGPVEGCDPRVMDAMNAAAQAKVAYDVAMMDEIIGDDDQCSVLELSGFENDSMFEARNAVFSGPFDTDLTPIISGPVLQLASTLGTNADCSSILARMNQIQSEGIKNGVPSPDFSEMINGTVPAGAGTLYTNAVNAAAGQGVFAAAQAAVAALPGPGFVPSFTAASELGSCEVLLAAGAIAGPCP